MPIQEYLKSIGLGFREEKAEAWLSLEARNLHMVLEELKKNGFTRVSAISGVDVGKNIEVIYHVFSEDLYVSVRVLLPKAKPEIKSVTGIYPSASMFERELHEMLGVQILEHPNLKGLFLNENSPKTPLRKTPETE
jgi:NADH-quinone oxidoreductase subunit C